MKGTLHWVSISHAINCEVRLYDRLFTAEDMNAIEGTFKDFLNPDSLQVVKNAYAEPALTSAKEKEKFQFLRKGYFVADKDSSENHLVFNRAVTLKDTWAKEQKKG